MLWQYNVRTRALIQLMSYSKQVFETWNNSKKKQYCGRRRGDTLIQHLFGEMLLSYLYSSRSLHPPPPSFHYHSWCNFLTAPIPMTRQSPATGHSDPEVVLVCLWWNHQSQSLPVGQLVAAAGTTGRAKWFIKHLSTNQNVWSKSWLKMSQWIITSV